MKFSKFKNDKDYIKSIVSNITPGNNGGESIQLYTHFFDNGDEKDNIWCSYELVLNSYGNSSSITFSTNLDNLEKAIRYIITEYDALVTYSKDTKIQIL